MESKSAEGRSTGSFLKLQEDKPQTLWKSRCGGSFPSAEAVPPLLLSLSLLVLFLLLQVRDLPVGPFLNEKMSPPHLSFSPLTVYFLTQMHIHIPVSQGTLSNKLREKVSIYNFFSDFKQLFICRDWSPCSLPACTCGKEVQLSPSWGTADYSLARIGPS